MGMHDVSRSYPLLGGCRMSLESIFVCMFMLAAIGLATVFAAIWWLITQLNRVDDDFEKRPFGGFPRL